MPARDKTMVTVYLNTNGNAREAADYYVRVFDAGEPSIMNYSDMPEADQAETRGMEHLVMHANVKTFGGDIMLSDNMPGETIEPTAAVSICFSHEDPARLRTAFERLAQDGEILMPLEPTFFSPLYGMVKDKFGFHWMIMSSEEA